MKFAPLITSALLLSCIFGSCSDSDSDADTHIATLYDIADVTAKSAGSTTFTVYRPDVEHAEAVKLTAPGYNIGDTELGTSVMLTYTPLNGKAYESGNITVEHVSSITNANLKKGSQESIIGWDDDPVWLMSLWQAGDKVMVRLKLPYSTEPRRFALVIDDSTADREYPDAYLYHRRPQQQPNFMRQYYAAFNLANLWNTPGIRGLRIHVANSNNPKANLFVLLNPNSTTD